MYHEAVLPQLYEFFMTENYQYYTLPGLFNGYEPRGIATLGSRVLVSCKPMGSRAGTPSLLVLMEGDQIRGIIRLHFSDGRPFNGSVTSVAVAGPTVWGSRRCESRGKRSPPPPPRLSAVFC